VLLSGQSISQGDSIPLLESHSQHWNKYVVSLVSSVGHGDAPAYFLIIIINFVFALGSKDPEG